MWPLHVLRGLSGLLLLVLLSIMAAGIMNTLWIAIRERTREIGTLRAIGMQRFGIARLFLFEAALLGIAAGTLGAALIGLINAARVPIPIAVQIFLMHDTLHFSLEPSTLLAGVVMVTSVTCLATLFPSVRAARRKPVEAMAHFG
jgi:ABC-type antimicrobial peptide transport system permease subunit